MAARRLARVRAVLTELSERHTMPVENLAPPDAVRRVAWTPPGDADAVAEALVRYGARSWQVRLTAELLTKALEEPTP